MANQTKAQTTFRLPPELLERLDRLARRLSREQPGLSFTRSDVVRMLLTRALDDEGGKEARRGKA